MEKILSEIINIISNLISGENNYMNMILSILGAFIYLIGKIRDEYAEYSISGVETTVQKIFRLIKGIFLLFIMYFYISYVFGFMLRNSCKIIWIELFAEIATIVYFLLMLCLIMEVVFSIDVKIEPKQWNIPIIIFYVVGFVVTILMGEMAYIKYNSSIIGYIVFSLFTSLILIYVFEGQKNKILPRKYYFIHKGRKCYIHNLKHKEVEYSYNRTLDRYKGSKNKKIKKIKQKTIICDRIESSYQYITEVLKENNFDVLDNREIVNCNINKLKEEFEILISEKKYEELPKNNWTFALLLKGSKKQIKKKLRNKDNGGRWSVIKAKKGDDKVFVLILYCKTKLHWDRVVTYRLDRYINEITAYFEYSLLEEEKKKQMNYKRI